MFENTVKNVIENIFEETVETIFENIAESIVENIFEDRFNSPTRSLTCRQGGVTAMKLPKESCQGRGAPKEPPNCQGGFTEIMLLSPRFFDVILSV